LFLIECYKIDKHTIGFSNSKFIEQFNQLENGKCDETFIEENSDILDLVENKEQLCKYLVENNKYDIIHDNEDISNNIRDKYKIVIFSLNHIEPITDDNTVEPITDDNTVVVTEEVTEEEIKKEYENRYIGFQVIFIL